MGTADLRAAFEQGAPGYSCNRVLMRYRSFGGRQFQVMTFSGIDPAGKAFQVDSEPVAPHADINTAAVELAKDFVARGGN